MPTDHRLAWWEQPYRIVQTNLRLIDAGLSPRELARDVCDFGASALTFNIGGIFAWYPTDLSLQARNPHLKGDLAGEMLAAAHEAGLKMVGRYDLSKGTRLAYDAHPEWFVHNKAGEPQEYNGTFQACVNGGWAREYAIHILEESLGQLNLDGVFFNMTGYQPYDYSGRYRGICHCLSCRDDFAAMFSRHLPEREDFTDPAFADYLQFKKRTSAAVSKHIYDTVKRLRPQVGVMGNGRGTCDFIRLELQRAVSRPAPEWPHQAGELCRWAAARHPGMPYACASTNFLDYQWRYASETPAHHLLRFGQTVANGGQIDYYVLGLLDQPNRAPLGPIRRFMQWHAVHAEHLARTKSLAKVALYHSRATELYAGATATAQHQKRGFRGAYRALLDGRVPFDFVSDERMGDPNVADRLADYDVILLPNVACISDAEAAQLDSFVDNGGTLIATGETGHYDEHGRRRGHVALRTLPIDHLTGACEGLETSFEIPAGELGFEETALLHLDGWYFRHAAAADAQCALTLLPQPEYGPPELCFAELPATGNPGVVERRAGRGRAVYLPWLPEWLYFRDGMPEHRALLLQLIARDSAALAKLEGDGPVELTVRESRDRPGEIIVHVVNYAGQRGSAYEEPPAITGLRLGIRCEYGLAQTLVVEGSLRLGSADAEGYRWLDLPPVKHFEVTVVRPGSF
jgi:hypothetical protein